MSEHFKGSDCYDMTSWILEHYIEMKHYNMPINMKPEINETFGLSDVTEYLFGDSNSEKYVCERKFPLTENLVKACDDTYSELRKYDAPKADVVYNFYMNSDFRDFSQGEKILKMGFTNGGFYKMLYKAVSAFSRRLWYNLNNKKELPFYMNDINRCKSIIESMDESYRLHEPGGKCYCDTERLLKAYTKIKYSGVQNRLSESILRLNDSFGRGRIYNFYDALDRVTTLDADTGIRNWMYSSMAANSESYLNIIDNAVKKMDTLGFKGKENSRYVTVMFLDPAFMDEDWKAKRDMLGLTHRIYYCRRHEAITMLSKILWGVLAQNHNESVFYTYRSIRG